MILLDTDHLSIITNQRAAAHVALAARLIECREAVAIPVVAVEEQCKGWLARLKRLPEIHDQIIVYERIIQLFHFFRKWEICPIDKIAAGIFHELRSKKIRIGTQDLKIASIALARDCLLLSANLRDFQKVPGLRVENWLQLPDGPGAD